MRLVPHETTLVIAGAWNPAILTPEWVLRHALQKELDATNKIQAAMPVGLLFEFPRFELEDLYFMARTDAFILFPKPIAEDRFLVIESVAQRTLDQLSHTPITGVGHNFEFRDETPNPGMLKAFSAAQQDVVDIAPAGFSVSSSGISTSLKCDQSIINIQRYFDGGRLGVKFNFHYPVSSATEASAVLKGDDGDGRFYKNYQTALSLVEQLYGKISND